MKTTNIKLDDKDSPEEALAMVVALRRAADQLEHQAVINAHNQGWSWSQIAAALGISRQAAHKKFSPIIKQQGQQYHGDIPV